jgi:hypothetical protein
LVGDQDIVDTPFYHDFRLGHFRGTDTTHRTARAHLHVGEHGGFKIFDVHPHLTWGVSVRGRDQTEIVLERVEINE